MQSLWSRAARRAHTHAVERPRPLWSHYGVIMRMGAVDHGAGNVWGARGGASHYGGTMESLWSRAARRSREWRSGRCHYGATMESLWGVDLRGPQGANIFESLLLTALYKRAWKLKP